MNPVSALTGATGDRMLDDPLVRDFCSAAMREAAAIGAAHRLPHRPGRPRTATTITRELGAFKTSMLQDVERGRPIELDAHRDGGARDRPAHGHADAQHRRTAGPDPSLRTLARPLPAVGAGGRTAGGVTGRHRDGPRRHRPRQGCVLHALPDRGPARESMIADVGAHLAAEHPIGPARVDQDDRQQEQRADQQEGLRARATMRPATACSDAARSWATG